MKQSHLSLLCCTTDATAVLSMNAINRVHFCAIWESLHMRSMQDVMKPKWITVRGPWDLILIQKGERAPLHAQVQSGIAEPVQNTPLPDFVSTFTTCVVLVSPAA